MKWGWNAYLQLLEYSFFFNLLDAVINPCISQPRIFVSTAFVGNNLIVKIWCLGIK